jgi:hypothetical protein
MLSLTLTLYSSLQHTLSLLSLLCLHQLSGNGFQCRSFLFPCSAASVLTGCHLTTWFRVAKQWLTSMGTLPPPTSPPGVTICDDLQQICLPTANWRLKTLSRLAGLCFDSPDSASTRIHSEHRFPHLIYCFMHDCCYANVVFHVSFLHHGLLCCDLVMDASST